ncbi:hypothetical protein [Paenibacillus mucilaginosus]|uniref:hypothetical protein n=1 Tax=Paenibacillus mucilaginosus TaxID=61624 RepID=UPI001EE654EF|nr:hypothetical protein [Paenibacillus mucilaginosus]
MKRDDLSLFSMLVYIGVYISGRYLLVEDIKLSFIPLILDLLLGVLIIVVSLLLKKLHSLAGIVFMLVFSLFHIANMEYIFAMDHTINLSDFKFLGDKQFLAGTLSHFNFPLYSVLLILSGLLSIFARPASKIFMKRSLVVSGISIVFLLFHAIVFPSAASWKESNFTVESFSNTLYSMSEAKTRNPWTFRIKNATKRPSFRISCRPVNHYYQLQQIKVGKKMFSSWSWKEYPVFTSRRTRFIPAFKIRSN